MPSRAPDEVPEQDDLAAEFLRLACLTYGADDPARWAAARALLADHPRLARGDVWVAAACADDRELDDLLAAYPRLAVTEGGPFGWPPLLYLAFARHDQDLSEQQTRAAATSLLDAGADPDSRYLWHGLEPPFTALSGALGSGEGGEEQHPQHPHGVALARLLLEHGADPNDGQALYNRMFEPDDRHLELLLEHGLSRPDLLAGQLSWAVSHGFADRVLLLHRHGVDLAQPLADYAAGGRSAWQLARWTGQSAIAELLAWLGLASELSPVDAVVAGVLGGERPEGPVADAVSARPGLVAWAASLGRPDAVRRAVEAGWDVNRRARVDVPSDQEWETGLHVAAGNGDLALIGLLLDLGADPALSDGRFDSTPLGWAEHFGHEAAMRLLRERAGN